MLYTILRYKFDCTVLRAKCMQMQKCFHKCIIMSEAMITTLSLYWITGVCWTQNQNVNNVVISMASGTLKYIQTSWKFLWSERLTDYMYLLNRISVRNYYTMHCSLTLFVAEEHNKIRFEYYSHVDEQFALAVPTRSPAAGGARPWPGTMLTMAGTSRMCE